MAVFHGKAGTVTWASGSTAAVTNWTLSVTADVAESTAMGNTYKARTVGFLDSSATVTAYVPSGGLDPSIGSDLGTPASLVLGDGNNTFTATMICTDISLNVDADGNPTQTSSFVGNGTAVIQT